MSDCQQSNGKGMAIASLVLGILAVSCCCCGGIAGILAIVFGLCAKSSMKRTGNYDGSAMATAGVVLGILSLIMKVIGIAVWLFLAVIGQCAGDGPFRCV
jgi:hypothetical protein